MAGVPYRGLYGQPQHVALVRGFSRHSLLRKHLAALACNAYYRRPHASGYEGLPASYVSPANEWYFWKPDPRRNPRIKVLMTLAPSNFPLGFKDTISGGDIPVTWINLKYRMIYTNMGHGNNIFDSPLQNRFFENAVLWLGGWNK